MALTAQDLLTGVYCLYEVSKDLNGEAEVLDSVLKTCAKPSCESLTLVQGLRLRVQSAQCDSTPFGVVLDGSMRIGDLTTVFTGPDEHHRGMHAGNFYWHLTGGGAIWGTVEGITNAGTARPPIFPQCQGCEECLQHGLLTGKLFATGRNVPGIPVQDFTVEAIYRLSWDPMSHVGGRAPAVGTLEGVLIMPCP